MIPKNFCFILCVLSVSVHAMEIIEQKAMEQEKLYLPSMMTMTLGLWNSLGEISVHAQAAMSNQGNDDLTQKVRKGLFKAQCTKSIPFEQKINFLSAAIQDADVLRELYCSTQQREFYRNITDLLGLSNISVDKHGYANMDDLRDKNQVGAIRLELNKALEKDFGVIAHKKNTQDSLWIEYLSNEDLTKKFTDDYLFSYGGTGVSMKRLVHQIIFKCRNFINAVFEKELDFFAEGHARKEGDVFRKRINLLMKFVTGLTAQEHKEISARVVEKAFFEKTRL